MKGDEKLLLIGVVGIIGLVIYLDKKKAAANTRAISDAVGALPTTPVAPSIANLVSAQPVAPTFAGSKLFSSLDDAMYSSVN